MLKLICWWIAVLGGLNLGIMGIFSVNLIEMLLGASFARIVYALIGIASVYLIIAGARKK